MKAMTTGGATVDTIAIIGSSRVDRMSMWNAGASLLLLAEGSTINTAVVLARLGADVCVLVKSGNDRHAELVAALKRRDTPAGVQSWAA